MTGPGADQEIRFCAVPGGRIAYATVGSGPPLVLPALWISHLELEWELPAYRAFVTALARDRTVVRYDRPGTGLSDRASAPAPGLDADVATLLALVEELGARAVSLLGISWGGCTAAAFAARHPARAERLVLFGSLAHGAGVAPPPLREALLATVRAHWGAGSRVLSDIWLPGADAAAREQFAALQRAAAPPEAAAAMLAAVYGADIRAELGAVRAPALVLHRRGDRAIPFELGRELAAHLPEARLVPLEGEVHPPWLGDADAVVRLAREFLGSAPEEAADAAPRARGPSAAPPAAREPSTSPLSAREAEVLRLVAEGLTDEQIAERLVVSPHTVHRHVANIRVKLRQPSRAASVAHAAREGLI